MAPPVQSVAARYFDDLAVGERFASAGFTFTEAGIIDFAWQFDPQPFHTDADYAREHSIYGGLIASGYHTLSVCFRLVHGIGLFAGTNITGRKLDGVRFLKPVFIGDTVHLRVTVEEKKAMRRLGGGLVNFKVEVVNQADDVTQRGNWELLVKGEAET